MSNYKISLKNVIIDESESKKIISYNNGIGDKLIKDKYTSVVCKAIQSQLKATVNIQWGKDTGNLIQIYTYCASKICKRKFKLFQHKVNIKDNENITFHVSSTLEHCDHNDKIIRQLRGEERTIFANDVKSSSIDNVRSKAIIESNTELLEKGHLQNIHPRPVLRKAVSQLNSRNDKSSDALIDFVMQMEDIECIYSAELKKDKFSVMILTDKQITILKSYTEKCRKNKIISRIHFDATGNVTASPHIRIRKLLHHILVIGHKFNDNDNSNTHVNIGEFVSCLHTSDNLEIFLRRFLQIASKQIKQNVIIEEVVTDFSWAALNSLCRSFNNMSIKSYLDVCFQILSENNHDKIHVLTILRLCSSHISKNMTSDISSCFKKEHRKVIAALIGGIFDLETFIEAESYIEKLLTILLSKTQSTKVKEAFKKFKNFAESSEWKIDDEITISLANQEYGEFDTIYKFSKFFQKFDIFVRTFEDTSSDQRVNPYYNPKFAAIFLKKYVAYLPFWSGLMTSLRYKGMDRANNGIIEGYNGNLKTNLKRDGLPTGKIKLTRYLQFMNVKILSAYKQFEFSIPRERVRYQKKKQSSEEETIKFNQLAGSIENWKGQGNGEGTSKSSQIMFNRGNISTMFSNNKK